MKTIISIFIFLGLFNSNHKTIGQTNPEAQITFKIRNMGVSVKGEFTDVFIESNINIDDLDNSFINAVIKVNSLNTDNKKRDEHLMKSDFFNVENFPEITFKSTKIEKIEGNDYNIIGNLAIKNKTKPVAIPVLFDDTSQSLTFNSNFELKRRDFGVGGKSWILSNKVKIQIHFSE
jgi:polyisoprenoid-binding protein YceI